MDQFDPDRPAFPHEPSEPRTAERPFAVCLEHQAVEDQMSPIGLVCPCCKHRLYVAPPSGRCRSFWESQPGAWSVDRQPCFVYTLLWDDCRIRSLHAPGVEFDPRGQLLRASQPAS